MVLVDVYSLDRDAALNAGDIACSRRGGCRDSRAPRDSALHYRIGTTSSTLLVILKPY